MKLGVRSRPGLGDGALGNHRGNLPNYRARRIVTRRRVSRILHVGVAAILLALVSCSPAQTSGTNEGSPETASAPVKRDQVVKIIYSAQIQGSLDVDFSQVISVRVLSMTSDSPDFKGISLLSVGPSEPVDLGDGRWFRIAFDLMRFTGNGKYKIKAGSPKDLVKQPLPQQGKTPEAPDQSNVLIQFWTTKPEFGVAPQVFDDALEPCPVEVEKGGFKGSLRCSQISDDNGSTLSILMRWG